MIFKIKSEKSSGWKACLGSISVINEEMIFTVNPEGISFQCMDISKVSFIFGRWNKDLFKEYNVKSELKLAVRVDDFLKIIKRAKEEDSIIIEDVNEGAAIQITIGDKKQYIMKLIHLDLDERPQPDLKSDVSFKLDVPEFDSILEDIKVVSDFVTIESTPKEILFTGKGDSGNSKTTIYIPCKIQSKSTFSIEFIQGLLKSVKGSVGSIILEYSQSGPLHLSLQVEDMGIIHYYLAPKQDSPYN
jgi:proliferating cell nuclear antigen